MHTPYYLLEENRLRHNLALIKDVADRTGAEIILAFKAFALWKTFPIFREYIHHTTASSPDEARLAFEEFGSPAHTYSPAYTEHDFPTILHCSSHITFNSLSQFHRYLPLVQQWNTSLASLPPTSAVSFSPTSPTSLITSAPSPTSDAPSSTSSVGAERFSREDIPSPIRLLFTSPLLLPAEIQLSTAK